MDKVLSGKFCKTTGCIQQVESHGAHIKPLATDSVGVRRLKGDEDIEHLKVDLTNPDGPLIPHTQAVDLARLTLRAARILENRVKRELSIKCCHEHGQQAIYAKKEQQAHAFLAVRTADPKASPKPFPYVVAEMKFKGNTDPELAARAIVYRAEEANAWEQEVEAARRIAKEAYKAVLAGPDASEATIKSAIRSAPWPTKPNPETH